jgi:hypothetical protein
MNLLEVGRMISCELVVFFELLVVSSCTQWLHDLSKAQTNGLWGTWISRSSCDEGIDVRKESMSDGRKVCS